MMNMTAVNILALIAAVVIVVKSLYFMMNPKKCFKMYDKYCADKQGLIIGLSVVLAVVTGYYVLMNVGLLETVAVLAFVASLASFSMSLQLKTAMKCAKSMAKDTKMCFLSILPWLALAAYALYVIFA